MPEYDVFYTEEPIKSIWNRLGYLSSVQMASKFLAEHPPTDPSDQTQERAESLAFAIRWSLVHEPFLAHLRRAPRVPDLHPAGR